MDAHRLRWVLDRVIGEHARLGIDHKFAQVIQALATCVSRPGGPSDEEFRIALTDLVTALRQSRSNDFVESSRRILMEIRGERHTGEGLAERIHAVTSEQPFLPGRAREAIVEIADDLQRFLGVCAAAQAALVKLNIEPARLGVEEYELGILLPDKLIQGDLERVLKELQDWNSVLRDLIPMVSEQVPCVVLRVHTTRRFELAASLDRVGALALGTVVAGVYRMFGRITANRDRAAELERQHYPPEIVRRVKDYEQQLVLQAIAESKEQFKSRFVRPGLVRRKDLDRTLDRTLRFLAMRIRDGVEVEIVGPPPVEESAAAEQPDRALPHQVRQALQTAARVTTKGGTGGPDRKRAPARIADERPMHLPLSKIASEEELPPQQAA